MSNNTVTSILHARPIDADYGYTSSILVKQHKKDESGPQHLSIDKVLPQMAKELFEKEKTAIKEELRQELLKEIDAKLGGLLSQNPLTTQEVDALKYTAGISPV